MFRHPDPFVHLVHSFITAHVIQPAMTDDRMGELRAISDLYAQSLRLPFSAAAGSNPHHAMPALTLAARCALRDIGAEYTLPRGLSPAVLEAYALTVHWSLRQGYIATTNARDHLLSAIQRLEDLNPQLRHLTYDRMDIRRCYDLVMGVSSGFHPDDIQFFLDGNYYNKAMGDPAYARTFAAASRALGDHDIFWVPSPATLERIIAQKQKPRQP